MARGGDQVFNARRIRLSEVGKEHNRLAGSCRQDPGNGISITNANAFNVTVGTLSLYPAVLGNNDLHILFDDVVFG